MTEAKPTTSGDPHDAVVVERVSKRFQGNVALDDVSVRVSSGELFGFIGPDGAGKTTLFRILTTLLLPDSGAARVLGADVVKDLWALRRQIGYMPGRFSLYPDLSVEENLRFFASVFGTTVEREYDQIAPIYVQLEPFRTRRAAALSGGMKQKLALCCALVHRPKILFLDEPTTGVDAVSRREFWELLAKFRAGGLTILVSTPYMDEADRCDRVALMQRGRVLAIDAPKAITASYGRPLFAVRAANRYGAIRALRAYRNTASVYPFGEALHFVDARADVAPDRIATEASEALRAAGIADASVSPTPATIEDVFMARMGAPEGEESSAPRGNAA
jgi:ABC-type multidrug transport system ATPase subunit